MNPSSSLNSLSVNTETHPVKQVLLAFQIKRNFNFFFFIYAFKKEDTNPTCMHFCHLLGRCIFNGCGSFHNLSDHFSSNFVEIWAQRSHFYEAAQLFQFLWYQAQKAQNVQTRLLQTIIEVFNYSCNSKCFGRLLI